MADRRVEQGRQVKCQLPGATPASARWVARTMGNCCRTANVRHMTGQAVRHPSIIPKHFVALFSQAVPECEFGAGPADAAVLQRAAATAAAGQAAANGYTHQPRARHNARRMVCCSFTHAGRSEFGAGCQAWWQMLAGFAGVFSCIARQCLTVGRRSHHAGPHSICSWACYRQALTLQWVCT